MAPCPGDDALPHIHFQVFLRVCVRTCLPFKAGVGATAQAADFPDAALIAKAVAWSESFSWILNLTVKMQSFIIYFSLK